MSGGWSINATRAISAPIGRAAGKQVADEMELLNRKYGVKALTFMDDDFNSDRQKMVDLVEALEEKEARHELVLP